MTDEEALKEIDRQEKRFAAAKCGWGLRLAKSARECYERELKATEERVAAGVERPIPWKTARAFLVGAV